MYFAGCFSFRAMPLRSFHQQLRRGGGIHLVGDGTGTEVATSMPDIEIRGGSRETHQTVSPHGRNGRLPNPGATGARAARGRSRSLRTIGACQRTGPEGARWSPGCVGQVCKLSKSCARADGEQTVGQVKPSSGARFRVGRLPVRDYCRTFRPCRSQGIGFFPRANRLMAEDK